MTPADATRAQAIRGVLENLIRQRHALEATAREPGLLDANRTAIVYWQTQLARIEGAGDRAR